MAVIREHLASKGLGLRDDPRNESPIVGDLPTVLTMRDAATEEQEADRITEGAEQIRVRKVGSARSGFGSSAVRTRT